MEMTQRFVALDVHKQYVMVAAIDATQQVTLSPRKISLEQFDTWVQTHLLPTDAVSDVNDLGSHSSHDRSPNGLLTRSSCHTPGSAT